MTPKHSLLAKAAQRLAKKYSPGCFAVVDTKTGTVKANGEAFAEAWMAKSLCDELNAEGRGKNNRAFRLISYRGKPGLRYA